MTYSNAENLLGLDELNSYDHKPLITAEPNTPLNSDYTMKNTYRSLQMKQPDLTHYISKIKLRIIIIVTITSAELRSMIINSIQIITTQVVTKHAMILNLQQTTYKAN